MATFPLLVGRRGRLWASSTPRYAAIWCASRLVMQHRLHSDPYPLDTFRVNCRAAAWGDLNPSQQPSAIPSTGRAAGSGTDLARGPQLLGSWISHFGAAHDLSPPLGLQSLRRRRIPLLCTCCTRWATSGRRCRSEASPQPTRRPPAGPRGSRPPGRSRARVTVISRVGLAVAAGDCLSWRRSAAALLRLSPLGAPAYRAGTSRGPGDPLGAAPKVCSRGQPSNSALRRPPGLLLTAFLVLFERSFSALEPVIIAAAPVSRRVVARI